jgi:hypothetical protein
LLRQPGMAQRAQAHPGGADAGAMRGQSCRSWATWLR